MWHDVATGVPGNDVRHDGGKLDHIVLGPSGLWGLLSEDWGEPVKLKRGELIGPALEPGEARARPGRAHEGFRPDGAGEVLGRRHRDPG